MKRTHKGRILVLEVDFDDLSYILINLYNPNTESKQIKTFGEISTMLKSINTRKVIKLTLPFKFVFQLKT